MRHIFLLPFALIGFAGCVHTETTAPRASTTVVTPVPAAPSSTAP
jgi:hypothetical protein